LRFSRNTEKVEQINLNVNKNAAKLNKFQTIFFIVIVRRFATSNKTNPVFIQGNLTSSFKENHKVNIKDC
jgi:hypothetical protein